MNGEFIKRIPFAGDYVDVKVEYSAQTGHIDDIDYISVWLATLEYDNFGEIKRHSFREIDVWDMLDAATANRIDEDVVRHASEQGMAWAEREIDRRMDR